MIGKSTLESVVVTSDREEAGVESSRRTLWRVFGVAMLCGILIAWFVWGPFSIVLYVSGLFNSRLAFILLPFLLLSIPAGVVLLPILLIYTILRRSKLSTREKVWHVGGIVVVAAFVASSILESTQPPPGAFSVFVRGLARYVDRRVDIAAAQDWLGTLDPNDCRHTRLEATAVGGVKISNSPTCIPAPPSLARLRHYPNQFSLDERGRLMIRFVLGGGGLLGRWGLVVGHADMAVPSSDLREEYFPLQPGAYIWTEW